MVTGPQRAAAAAPRAAGKWRRRALLAVALVVLLPAVCLEAAYRMELATFPQRPPLPIPVFPPLVLHAFAAAFTGTARLPEARGIYPWTVARILAKAELGLLRRDEMSADANVVAARTLLFEEPRPRGMMRWHLANIALQVWISRHLTTEEALSTALAMTDFGRRARGFRQAAQIYSSKQVEQLDVEEVARLMALESRACRRSTAAWRARRDYLLRELRRVEAIDEATLRWATARPIPELPPGSNPEHD